MSGLGFFGKIAFLLVIIGGLNWGLVGLFNIDIVQAVLGSMPAIQKAVYVLVGVSALFLLVRSFVR